MKRSLLKLIALVIILSLLLSTVSCNRKYDENEVLTAAEALLKQTEILNIVYYGDGIQYHDGEENNGYYRRANDAHLKELGFSTIDELITLTDNTFTKEYADTVYSTVLRAIKDETTVISPARYYQEYNDDGAPLYIMVHSAYPTLMKDDISYDYASMKVSGVKKKRVFVKVSATVTNSEGQSQNTEITIALIEEDNGWRIDNPTYANYNSRA